MRIIFSSAVVFLILANLFASSYGVFAQGRGSVFAEHYLPESKIQGKLFGGQNWAVAEDDMGRLFFGNSDGVLTFDGGHWNIIPISNNSPVRSLATDSKGIIYVGGYNEFGYLFPDDKGEMVYHSLSDDLDENLKDFSELWRITEVNDSIFFISQKYLFCFANNKISHWDTGFDSFYLTYNVDNKLYTQVVGLGLMQLVNGELTPLDIHDKLKSKAIHAILPLKNGYAICTRNSGIYIVDSLASNQKLVSLSDISPDAAIINKYVTTNPLYTAIALPCKNLALGLISGEVLIVDQNWVIVDIIDREALGVNSAVYDLYMSSQNVLWLALDRGIAKAEVFSAYRYWKESRGINGTLADIARIRDTLYINTGAGIFFIPSGDNNVQKKQNFQEINVKIEQAWEFLYFLPEQSNWQNPYSHSDSVAFDEQNTLLLAATSQGIIEINGTNSRVISNYNGVFALHQFRKDPSKLLIGLTDGVVLLEYSDGEWIDWGYLQGINKMVNDIGGDEDGNLWFSSAFTGLYRLKFPFTLSKSANFELFETTHGLESLAGVKIYDEYNPIVFVDDLFNTYFFDTSKEIFALADSAMHSQLFNLNAKERYYDRYSRRLQDKRLTGTYVSRLTDTVFWMQTTYGYTRFKDVYPKDFSSIPNPIISRVYASDSLIFGGFNISSFNKSDNFDGLTLTDIKLAEDFSLVLSYSNNDVSFYYSLPFYEEESKNEFSCLLLGRDKHWSDWHLNTKREYINLPPGSYVFKVKARNLYGVESSIEEFYFSVLPPWYRTYYAYAIYLLLLVAIVVAIVKFYTRRLIKEKNKLEDLIKERTQKIVKQKEEILNQSEHLKDANDWILAKNEELESQKKELELSNATKNKFFRIVAHDLRSPISTSVSTTDFILSNFDETEKSTIKDFIERLQKLSITTYGLLENLLDWSTSQMGQITFKPEVLELNFLVNETVDLVRSVLESKNIGVKIDIPKSISIYADENMLRTVIRNLLSNAVKFTHQNGEIKIVASVHNDYCFVSIEDNGVGIPKKSLDKLFRIDEDVKSSGTNNERGTGLGLIICKEFIEKNGGTITVQSELGKGSVFTISVKLA